MTRRILAFFDMLPAEAAEHQWILYAVRCLNVSWDTARRDIQEAIDCGLMVVVRTEVLA